MMIAGPVVAVAGGIVAGMMAANNEGQGGEVGKEGGKEERSKKGTLACLQGLTVSIIRLVIRWLGRLVGRRAPHLKVPKLSTRSIM